MENKLRELIGILVQVNEQERIVMIDKIISELNELTILSNYKNIQQCIIRKNK
jgi:hypothetical protein